MDEILTPDSSRFWPREGWREGANPPSFDKQFLRDWLEAAQVDGQPWNKKAPAPRAAGRRWCKRPPRVMPRRCAS